MKQGIHPKKQPTLFVDTSCGKQFLLDSTINSSRKGVYEVDGKEYPMVQIETSSGSHPVYTGKEKIQAQEGRVAKFKNRYKL